MTTLPVQTFSGSFSAKSLCRIVGIACIAGFIVDMLTLLLPPALGSLEWRVNVLQQFSDRSIIFLFGIALVTYSSLEIRLLRKQLALLCLALGVVFLLSCILVVRDSLTLQQQAIRTINNQATQLQSQIQSSQTNAKLPPNVTPEQLQQFSQQVSTQAVTLKENAQKSTLKAAIAAVGNLLIVGLALISLGRYGLRSRKA